MEPPKGEFNLEQTIREILSDGKETPSIFDRLLLKFESFSDRPVSSLGDLKRRDNKRLKGLAWERFCCFYLSRVMEYQSVWLWSDIPDQVRAVLKLGSRVDNGIDIVACRGQNSGYVAVQCKYRKKILQTVTWTTLATFVGLCAQTGPWEKQIVMTNCKGVSRKTGIPRTPKDQTIAYGTFKNLSRAQCTRIEVGGVSQDRRLVETETREEKKPLTQEELRAIRLSKFTGQEQSSNPKTDPSSYSIPEEKPL